MEKEPKIVTLKNPIKFVGLSIKTDLKNVYKDAANLGKEYAHIKAKHQIPNLIEPWAFSMGIPMANKTCEGSNEPDAQADPVDTAIPSKSR